MEIEYDAAVRHISALMDRRVLKDAFQGSSVLAQLFNLPKEITLEDLLEYRSLFLLHREKAWHRARISGEAKMTKVGPEPYSEGGDRI